jgi:hypothetical protein
MPTPVQLFQNKIHNYLIATTPLSNNKEGGSTSGQLAFYFDYLTKNPHIKTIIEIGFNVGVSAAAFLSIRDDIRVLSIDIGFHEHVIPCKRVIDSQFPGRHMLLLGDSVTTMPLLKEFFTVREGLVDLIFIDGNHMDPAPRLDILNAIAFSGSETIIMVDDVCQAHGTGGVLQAVEELMRSGAILLQGHFAAEDRGWALFKRGNL